MRPVLLIAAAAMVAACGGPSANELELARQQACTGAQDQVSLSDPDGVDSCGETFDRCLATIRERDEQGLDVAEDGDVLMLSGDLYGEPLQSWCFAAFAAYRGNGR